MSQFDLSNIQPTEGKSYKPNFKEDPTEVRQLPATKIGSGNGETIHLGQLPRKFMTYSISYMGYDLQINNLELARNGNGNSSFDAWVGQAYGMGVIELMAMIHHLIDAAEHLVLEAENDYDTAYGRAYINLKTKNLGRIFRGSESLPESDRKKSPDAKMISALLARDEGAISRDYRQAKETLAQAKLQRSRLEGSLEILKRVYYSTFPKNNRENSF